MIQYIIITIIPIVPVVGVVDELALAVLSNHHGGNSQPLGVQITCTALRSRSGRRILYESASCRQSSNSILPVALYCIVLYCIVLYCIVSLDDLYLVSMHLHTDALTMLPHLSFDKVFSQSYISANVWQLI